MFTDRQTEALRCNGDTISPQPFRNKGGNSGNDEEETPDNTTTMLRMIIQTNRKSGKEVLQTHALRTSTKSPTANPPDSWRMARLRSTSKKKRHSLCPQMNDHHVTKAGARNVLTVTRHEQLAVCQDIMSGHLGELKCWCIVERLGARLVKISCVCLPSASKHVCLEHIEHSLAACLAAAADTCDVAWREHLLEVSIGLRCSLRLAEEQELCGIFSRPWASANVVDKHFDALSPSIVWASWGASLSYN